MRKAMFGRAYEVYTYLRVYVRVYVYFYTCMCVYLSVSMY